VFLKYKTLLLATNISARAGFGDIEIDVFQ